MERKGAKKIGEKWIFLWADKKEIARRILF